MNRICRLIIAASIAGANIVAPTLALAQDLVASLPSRVDVIQFESLTLPDSAFLKGDRASARPVMLGADLRIAQGPGKRPLVVLLHGSAGINGANDLWARDFAEIGVSTLMIDSFTARGVSNTLEDQSQLGALNMALDAYRALGVVKSHPRVDASRIALIGFSRGGRSALYASLDRFNTMWNESGLEFAAYLPFYPDCTTTFIDDTKVRPAPIRIHHGEIDDYTSPNRCMSFTERLKSAGRDAQITIYKDASHLFDSPVGPLKPTPLATATTVRNCVLTETAIGQIVSAATGQPFTYADACVERGPHIGYNPEASKAARASVRESLKTIFKL